MADLDAVRSGIDTIDDALVDLLARRQRLVEQAATFKRDAGEVRGEERRRLVMAMIDEFVALELRAHGGPHG